MRTILSVVALGIGVAAFTPTVAEGHYISYASAVRVWYDDNYDRCGAGDYWSCYIRKISVSCPYSFGNHSWHCQYTFREIRIPTLVLRTCRVEGQLEHYTMNYRKRTCW